MLGSSARRRMGLGLGAHPRQYFLLARSRPRPKLKFDCANSDTNSPYAHAFCGVMPHLQPGGIAGCYATWHSRPGGSAGRAFHHKGHLAGGIAAECGMFPAGGLAAGKLWPSFVGGPAGGGAAGRPSRRPRPLRRKFDRADTDTNSPYAHPLMLALSSIALLFAGLTVRHLASEFVRSIQDVSREFRVAVVTEVHETIWVVGTGVRYILGCLAVMCLLLGATAWRPALTRLGSSALLAIRRHLRAYAPLGWDGDASPPRAFAAMRRPAVLGPPLAPPPPKAITIPFDRRPAQLPSTPSRESTPARTDSQDFEYSSRRSSPVAPTVGSAKSSGSSRPRLREAPWSDQPVEPEWAALMPPAWHGEEDPRAQRPPWKAAPSQMNPPPPAAKVPPVTKAPPLLARTRTVVTPPDNPADAPARGPPARLPAGLPNVNWQQALRDLPEARRVWRQRIWELARIPSTAVPHTGPATLTVMTPQCLEVLLRLLDCVRSRVEIFSYSLDHPDIVEFLSRALLLQVPVCILAAMRQLNQRAEGSPQQKALGLLLERGAEVRALSLRDPRNLYPCLHAKAVIFDRCVLWCGSFNFTRQAAYNLELAHVTDCATAVQAVRAVFRRAWAGAAELEYRAMAAGQGRILMPVRVPQELRSASFYGGAQQ